MGHLRQLLDQALDAAEALGQLPDPRLTDETDSGLLGGGEGRDHPAEVRHLPRRDLVAGVVRQARVKDPLDGLVLVEERVIRRASSQCWRIRTASVFTPRRTSQASKGPGTAPRDFCRKRSRSAIVGSLVAAKPPITSE